MHATLQKGKVINCPDGRTEEILEKGVVVGRRATHHEHLLSDMKQYILRQEMEREIPFLNPATGEPVRDRNGQVVTEVNQFVKETVIPNVYICRQTKLKVHVTTRNYEKEQLKERTKLNG